MCQYPACQVNISRKRVLCSPDSSKLFERYSGQIKRPSSGYMCDMRQLQESNSVGKFNSKNYNNLNKPSKGTY